MKERGLSERGARPHGPCCCKDVTVTLLPAKTIQPCDTHSCPFLTHSFQALTPTTNPAEITPVPPLPKTAPDAPSSSLAPTHQPTNNPVSPGESVQTASPALTILAAARRQYQIACDPAAIATVNSCHVKIKGDTAMTLARQARQSRDYDQCVVHVSEALFHFKVLAGVTETSRSMPLTTAANIEASRRIYIALRSPLAFVRNYAIVDGKNSRACAIALLDERRYDEARVMGEDATVCFKFGNVPDDESGLASLFEHITLSGNAAVGDAHLEKIAAQLKPVVYKDYPTLLKLLSAADGAYKAAYDSEGSVVVRRMRKCLASLRACDVAWYNLAHCLERKEYNDACEALVQVRKCLYLSTATLPVITHSQSVGPDLNSLVATVLNCNLPSVTVIAALAMQDGARFVTMAKKHLKEGGLEGARERAGKGRKCYEWVVSRRGILGDQLKKESFECDEQELNLDVEDSQMKNIPETKVCVDLVTRFNSTFQLTGRETFSVDVREAGAALTELAGIVRQVTTANALLAAGRAMEAFYVKEKEGDASVAFEALDEAKGIFERHGFGEKAVEATMLRFNTQGDLKMDGAMKKIMEQGDAKEAMKELKEAMRFYKKGANEDKFKATEATLMCCEGDAVLSKFDNCLQNGDYDGAQKYGSECLELYRKAGDDKRIELVGEPESVVLKAALKDAESYKSQSLTLIETRDLATARTLAMKARECLMWCGNSTDSIEDIFSVIKMAEKRWKGDELMEAAMAVLDDHDRIKSHEMLKRAKAMFSEAQATYQELMGRAAEIISSNEEDDPSFGLELQVRKDGRRRTRAPTRWSKLAMKLTHSFPAQDNVINLYNVCRDGVKMAKLEDMELCLRADENLDKLGTLVRSELFVEARLMIEEARKTYAKLGLTSEDDVRVRKTSTLLQLVESGQAYFNAIDSKQFEDGKVFMSNCKAMLAEITSLQPKTIRDLDALIFGQKSAADTVIERALTSGEEDIKEAEGYINEENFVDAKKCCEKAMESYQWVSKYIDWSKISGKIEGLEGYIAEVKRKESHWFGQTKLDKATGALEDDKYSFAILTLEQSIDDFKASGDEEKTNEAMLLKARAHGQLRESQARALWEKKDFEKAHAKALGGLEDFKVALDEQRGIMLQRFEKRVQGDLIMTKYPDALKNCDWDRACQLMTDAHACFNLTADPRKMSEVEGIEPKVKVKDVAMKKGEDLKQSAGSILHRDKDFVKAQTLLDEAKVCFEWSGVSLTKAGISMIQKDIDGRKKEAEADGLVSEAFALFEKRAEGGEGDRQELLEQCLAVMADAKLAYKASGPGNFKQASDLSIIINVLNTGSGTKEADEMLKQGEVVDALHFVGEVCDTWTGIVRISAGGSVGIMKFVKLFEGKEKQLSLVKNVLKKVNEVTAEIANSRWNPPPVSLCEELGVIYGGLKKEFEGGRWFLDCGFEYIEALVFEAEIKCGLREPEKVEEQVVEEPAVEEPAVAEAETVFAEGSLESLLSAAADEEMGEEVADQPSVVESMSSVVAEETISNALDAVVGRSSPVMVEEEVMEEAVVVDQTVAQDYEDEVFDEGEGEVEEEVVLEVEGGEVEVIDATNDKDEVVAGGDDYEEEFEEPSIVEENKEESKESVAAVEAAKE